jgi:aminopeptidase N
VQELKQALLNDKFWGVQAAAARALGEIKTEDSFNALVDGLKMKHPKARRAVVSALGEFRRDGVVNALIPLLEKEESYFVQAEAGRSIGKSRTKDAFKALQSALAMDSFNDVIRSQALEGFAELRDEAALPILMEWSAYGKPARPREAALANMGRLGEYRHDKRDLIDLLSETLEESWLRSKLSALESLKTLKDESVIPAISRVADRDKDGRVVRRAREAIQQIRQGRDRGEDVKKLREDLERQADDDRKLKERLDSLESKLNDARPS